MAKWLRDNGLTMVLSALFLGSFIGQLFSGWAVENQERLSEGASQLSLSVYFVSGAFLSSVFENWESEFLQMALFVVATTYLRQKGSSESKPFEPSPVDEDPRRARDKNSPWPVRRGGIALRLYEHSLSLSLSLLFIASFVLHAVGGAAAFNEEALRHGGETVTVVQYFARARFWFESFQNWQSEFLSVGVLVLFSIVLRDRGSSQSKPVAAAHAHTGES